jgi:hypothetical protein
MRQPERLTRRRLLGRTAGFPSHVLGGSGQVPPSERLNVAVIGTGGQGVTNIKALLTHPDVRIVAICDPAEFWDNSHLYYRHHGGRGPAMKHRGPLPPEGSAGDHGCAVYLDYRVMLEKMGRDIDAVLIAAPNHIHAVACLAAIEAGKGVYCEKPLTRTVYEARRVAAAAREAKVATQMGNHGHSSDDIRRAVEWIRDGAIGKVRQVHGWRSNPPRMTLTARPRKRRRCRRAWIGTSGWARPRAALPSRLYPVVLSLLVGFRHRDPGQLRLSHTGHRRLGPGPGTSDDDRGQFHPVERGDRAGGGPVPLQVPGARDAAGGGPVLV